MSRDDRRHRPPLTKWYVWVFGVLVLIPVVFFFMLVATDPGDNVVVEDATFAAAPAGGRVVSGTVRNTTENTYTQVRVQLELFDREGGAVGRVTAEVGTLEALGSRAFEAPVGEDGAVDFRARVTSPDNRRPRWLGGCRAPNC